MAKEKEAVKSLEEVSKDLNKKYGEGSVMFGNEKEQIKEVVSTGSLGLDLALGCGGIPVGRGTIVEVIGWESSGKSTLAQTIIANCQAKGINCLLLDGEGSLEAKYATNLGIDLEKLIVVQLDEHAGEGAYDKMERLVETGQIGVVVIDSYNALQPLKVVEGEMGESAIGLHSRMLGKAVVKANSLAATHGTIFIFIGQLREKIGVMFGSPETTQGGNALKFYAHVRLRVSRSITNDNSVMQGDIKMGNKTTVKVEKNKYGPPFRTCSFDILYGQGIDTVNELIDIAHDYGVLKKYGKTITYPAVEGKKFDATEFKTLLTDNEGFFHELRTKVLNYKQFEVEIAETKA